MSDDKKTTYDGLPLVTLETLNEFGLELVNNDPTKKIREWIEIIDQENVGISSYMVESTKVFPEEERFFAFSNMAGLYMLLKRQAEKNRELEYQGIKIPGEMDN